MLLGNSFCDAATKLLNNCGNLVRDCVEPARRSRQRDFSYAEGRRGECGRGRMLERLGELTAHLRFEQRAVRIFRFVARNKPETRPHVYRHQDDKRDPNAACHFSPALGNAGVAGQNHLTRLAANVFVNSARAYSRMVADELEAVTDPNFPGRAAALLDGVVLSGQVIQPSSKSDAEFRIRRIESVAKVVNDIQVLPLSQADNDIRLAVYRSLFNINSSLVGYALGANPSIHIIVENGRVALKGVVSNAIDRQIASVKAKSVFGVFDVDNQLRLPSEI